MFRFAICDDDEVALSAIAGALSNVFEKNRVEVCVKTFLPAADLYEKLTSEYFDAVFLDINMPGCDGIELIQHISGDGVHPYPDTGHRIDTAMLEIADEPHLHMEMTVKGLQVNPLDYFSAAVIASIPVCMLSCPPFFSPLSLSFLMLPVHEFSSRSFLQKGWSCRLLCRI